LLQLIQEKLVLQLLKGAVHLLLLLAVLLLLLAVLLLLLPQHLLLIQWQHSEHKLMLMDYSVKLLEHNAALA
jgi:uncharacterized membrane protein YbhN (UPF0104 family)